MIGRRGCISLIRRQFGHQSNPSPIGFIGLGHMGSKMVARLAEDGKFLMVYDKNPESCQKIVDERVRASSIEEICGSCNVIISMLPNDKIVQDVSHQILKNTSGKQVIHVSCSTVSPTTSRALESTFKENGSTFVASPVFARPDGIARREATWMMSGNPEGKKVASELLQSLGKVVDFGDDVGSANIVKLCGNFLIASTIESIGEAMALSEKHGVDRMKVMDLLSSTIFNCLIYKGYGQRVSTRDHRPGGFSLALGQKDLNLVSQSAEEVDVPMPVLSVLLDRFTSAKAKGRSDFDWSAIGLNIAEDAGIDVSQDVARNRKDIDEGRTY